MSPSETDTQQQLLTTITRLRREQNNTREQVRFLEKDARTLLLRPFPTERHLNALLRNILKKPGARRLLQGVAMASLTDDEAKELRLTVTVVAPIYPDPPFASTPLFQRVFGMLGEGFLERAGTDRVDGQDEQGQAVTVPCRTIGTLDHRHALAVFVDEPRVAARIIREVVQTVHDRSVNQVKSTILPLRADYGGALLSETLIACYRWQRKWRGEGLTTEMTMELVRTVLIGIAEARFEQRRTLAALALQARLKDLQEPTLSRVLPLVNRGSHVLASRELEGLVAASTTQGAFVDGRPVLDGRKLEENIKDFGDTVVRKRANQLTQEAGRLTGVHASGLQLERLIYLAAHGLLGEFHKEL